MDSLRTSKVLVSSVEMNVLQLFTQLFSFENSFENKVRREVIGYLIQWFEFDEPTFIDVEFRLSENARWQNIQLLIKEELNICASAQNPFQMAVFERVLTKLVEREKIGLSRRFHQTYFEC